MKTAQELYRALVLEHGKAPRNEGGLAEATHEATAKNPLCGDRVTLRLVLDAQAISMARFEVRGCMIARASASLLTEAVGGKSAADARAMGDALAAFLASGAVDVPPALAPLAGARDFPARRACVLLPWQALAAALAR